MSSVVDSYFACLAMTPNPSHHKELFTKVPLSNNDKCSVVSPGVTSYCKSEIHGIDRIAGQSPLAKFL